MSCNTVCLFITTEIEIGRTTDDQWGTGFIDEDVIYLINNGVIEWALTLLGFFRESIVPLLRDACYL